MPDPEEKYWLIYCKSSWMRKERTKGKFSGSPHCRMNEWEPKSISVFNATKRISEPGLKCQHSASHSYVHWMDVPSQKIPDTRRASHQKLQCISIGHGDHLIYVKMRKALRNEEWIDLSDYTLQILMGEWCSRMHCCRECKMLGALSSLWLKIH